VRLFASLYPQEVAGMVLVDAAPEDQFASFSAPQLMTRVRGDFDWLRYRIGKTLLARFGVLRLKNQPNGNPADLPMALRPQATAVGLRTRAYDWVFGESSAISASSDEARAAGSLGKFPLIVLSARVTAGPPWMTAEEADRIWQDLQGKHTRLTTRSRYILVENANHMIQLDRPDAVIGAICEVVDAARAVPESQILS
jgi:pimeloyl-ACP methyl ester carboxylesterase